MMSNVNEGANKNYYEDENNWLVGEEQRVGSSREVDVTKNN